MVQRWLPSKQLLQRLARNGCEIPKYPFFCVLYSLLTFSLTRSSTLSFVFSIPSLHLFLLLMGLKYITRCSSWCEKRNQVQRQQLPQLGQWWLVRYVFFLLSSFFFFYTSFRLLALSFYFIFLVLISSLSDWHGAAEWIGNAIHEINPNLLVWWSFIFI